MDGADALTQAGKPLGGVNLKLESATKKKPKIRRAAKTGATGKFVFELVPAGQYSLAVTRRINGGGLCSASVDAKVRSGRTTKVRFDLPKTDGHYLS